MEGVKLKVRTWQGALNGFLRVINLRRTIPPGGYHRHPMWIPLLIACLRKRINEKKRMHALPETTLPQKML